MQYLPLGTSISIFISLPFLVALLGYFELPLRRRTADTFHQAGRFRDCLLHFPHLDFAQPLSAPRQSQFASQCHRTLDCYCQVGLPFFTLHNSVLSALLGSGCDNLSFSALSGGWPCLSLLLRYCPLYERLWLRLRQAIQLLTFNILVTSIQRH